jgi:hypothetical protein
MDEAYKVILAWLDKEFPSGAYLSEHWSKDDASAYLSGRGTPELPNGGAGRRLQRRPRRDGPDVGSRALVQHQRWKRQEVRAGSHWNEPGGVRVVLERADGRTVGAFGSENEALCRAALKVVTA